MPDDRPDSIADDGAVFAPTRVRGGRSRRALAAVVVLALGALIAVGALDRRPTPETASVVGPSNDPAVNAPATARATGRTGQRSNRFTDDPIVPTFDLDVQAAGSHLFIHGDVFSLAVARVAVTIADVAGNVGQTQAVDIPGGSTAFRLGAVPRFDVHFFLPDEIQADGFIVSATALDSKGHDLATLRQLVRPAQASM